MLLLLLWTLTTLSCVSTKPQKKIELPPKPQRMEMEAPETLKDYAHLIVYYEFLVQEWESWGDTVSAMVE